MTSPPSESTPTGSTSTTARPAPRAPDPGCAGPRDLPHRRHPRGHKRSSSLLLVSSLARACLPLDQVRRRSEHRRLRRPVWPPLQRKCRSEALSSETMAGPLASWQQHAAPPSPVKDRSGLSHPARTASWTARLRPRSPTAAAMRMRSRVGPDRVGGLRRSNAAKADNPRFCARPWSVQGGRSVWR